MKQEVIHSNVFDIIHAMDMSLPQIRFKYGWLLAEVTAEALSRKNNSTEPLGTDDELLAITKKYEAWWAPYNDQIVKGICSVLGLTFKQNVIDVYVSPWFTPISDPLVIGPAFRSQDALISTVSHELIHRILTDNTSVDPTRDLLQDWKDAFGTNHDKKVLVHIPVHAVLKQLYVSVLDRPDLVELDIKNTKHNKPYAQAWDYVQAHDHAEIIRALSISKSS